MDEGHSHQPHFLNLNSPESGGGRGTGGGAGGRTDRPIQKNFERSALDPLPRV